MSWKTFKSNKGPSYIKIKIKKSKFVFAMQQSIIDLFYVLFLRRPNIRPHTNKKPVQQRYFCHKIDPWRLAANASRATASHEWILLHSNWNEHLLCGRVSCLHIFSPPARDINCRSQNIPTINRFHSQLIRHLARITSSSSSSSRSMRVRVAARESNRKWEWKLIERPRASGSSARWRLKWKCRKGKKRFSLLFFRPSRSARTNLSPRTVNKMMGGFCPFFATKAS